MIQANHTPWCDTIFRRYLERLLRRQFHSIRILGEIPEIDASLPLLLTPNHSNWWDGYFVYTLNKHLLKREMYVMMQERALRKLPLLARIGAFSVEPADPASVRASLHYAASVMQEVGHKALLCIFPQGRMHRWHARPLEYQRGLEVLLKVYNGRLTLLPLAIRVELYKEQRPEIFLMFGDAVTVDHTTFPGVGWLEQHQVKLLSTLQTKIDNNESGETLFQGRRSLHTILETLRKITR